MLMEHSENDAVHKIPRKTENALAESAEIFSIGKILYRIRYKMMDVLLDQFSLFKTK